MKETPPFDASVVSFAGFLRDQGFSTDLAWVFREDVVSHRCSLWVRTPLPADNAALARDYFEYGRRQGRGVTLEVLCRLGGRSACYVWVPEDDVAASQAMQGPLKIKVPTEPVEARAVGSVLRWQLICIASRWRGYGQRAHAVPGRADARRLAGTRRRPCSPPPCAIDPSG